MDLRKMQWSTTMGVVLVAVPYQTIYCAVILPITRTLSALISFFDSCKMFLMLPNEEIVVSILLNVQKVTGIAGTALQIAKTFQT